MKITVILYLMNRDQNDPYDILIVGGGIAGSVAAWTFSRQGLSVALVDEREIAAPFFRAERISSLAIADMRGLGLGELIDEVAIPLEKTAIIKGGKIQRITDEVDYSVPLHQLVNRIRESLKDNDLVEFISDVVESVETNAEQQRIFLKKGQFEIYGKLLVVATGASNAFLKYIGVEREIISKNHSSTFGFDLIPGPDFELPASSVTIRICREGADYMNVFPTPEGGYRANLFTYWKTGDDAQKEFVKGDSTALLKRLSPSLMKATGSWEVGGTLECGMVSVMKSTGYQQPGFVLIGDAYGRICPCCGRGINKVIRDVLTLQKLVPDWIKNDIDLTPGVLEQYYHDDTREAYEEWVYTQSMTLRERIVESGPKQILRRIIYHHLPPKLQDIYWKHLGSKRRAPIAL